MPVIIQGGCCHLRSATIHGPAGGIAERWVSCCGLSLLLLSAAGARAKPQVVFWWDSHPGMPPKEEWRKDDTAVSLAKEMHYANMKARPGSPKHYRRLRALGFDAVGLPGFEGPIQQFDPDSDGPANLDPVKQTRNARYYIGWARKARLRVYLNIQFFGGQEVMDFIWKGEPWDKVLEYVRSIARFAKRSRCDGLIFDFEPYKVGFQQQWSLQHWHERTGLERQAALELLRQRGLEFARAIASQFPRCVLHVYGMGYGAFAPGPKDFEDTNGYFLAGLCEAQLPGGVHLNMGHTYYRYDPKWVSDTYRLEMLPLLARAVEVSRVPDYVRGKCSIALGSAAIHRWHSGDGMYDRAVYRITTERYEAHLVALLRNCPKYVWMCGEASFDWTMPEISREVKDDPYGYWGLDVPFVDVSERNRKLVETFAQVMRLTDSQIAARYEAVLEERERQMEQRKRLIPKATIALLYNNEGYLEFDNDADFHIRHVWSINGYPKLDLPRLTDDLGKTDIVICCVSPVWADRPDEELIARPRPLPAPEEWRAFVERGGILVFADFATNPNASGWLASIARELSPNATPARCEPNKPPAWWNEKEQILVHPNRLRLFTCGSHLECEDLGQKGWVVLAACEHRKPMYLMRPFGKGLVVVLMSSKFQVGFGWEHLVDLLKAVR